MTVGKALSKFTSGTSTDDSPHSEVIMFHGNATLPTPILNHPKVYASHDVCYTPNLIPLRIMVLRRYQLASSGGNDWYINTSVSGFCELTYLSKPLLARIGTAKCLIPLSLLPIKHLTSRKTAISSGGANFRFIFSFGNHYCTCI